MVALELQPRGGAPRRRHARELWAGPAGDRARVSREGRIQLRVHAPHDVCRRPQGRTLARRRRGEAVAMRAILIAALGCVLITASLFAQSQAVAGSTPHTLDGHVDLNGIWGATALPPAVKPGQSVRWLLPLKGVDPEGTDVFKGLDRIQVNNRAAATNKPEYKAEFLAKVKEFSDKQGILDPAFYCKPQGVPRMW